MKQIELLRYTIEVLERLRIPYAVVGSYASSAWGEPRMTRDIDVVIQLSPGQVAPLCVAFPNSEFYVSETAAREAITYHGQFNVIHPASGNKIDFMIVGGSDWSAAQLQRREQIQFDPSTRGYVAAAEDVILGKLLYLHEGGSEKHIRDISGILKLHKHRLDLDYISKIASQLGCTEIWQSIVDRDLICVRSPTTSNMHLAYNTNGLAHHELIDGIELLSSIGYRGVAITLDHGALNPYLDSTPAQLVEVAELLKLRHLQCVIETGGRFLLDPHVKHEPTLVSTDAAGRSRRVEFLCRAIDIAAQLKAECVSLWSGVVHDGAGGREVFSRLVGALADVLDYANSKGVMLGFEPEPGMLVDTMGRYADLLEELAKNHIDSSRLRLTIDIGHLHCLGEVPIADQIREWADRLANVHIEDMRQGVHEHLMFGEGEIDFPPVFAALRQIRYSGLVSVELSRHSHEAPTAARRAYNYLRPLIDDPPHG